MLNLPNREILEGTGEKFQQMDLNCNVIGIYKKITEFKCQNMEDKHDVFVVVLL